MMEKEGKIAGGSRLLISVACFVIIVAGMRAASSILVPFLLAVFISIICTPLLFWMQRKGIPNGLAVLSILIGIIAAGLLLTAFLGTSLNGFTKALPVYQNRLSEETAGFVTWLRSHGLEFSDEVLNDLFDPRKAMRVIANVLAGLRGVFTNAFLILLTVIFILLEASGFPQKLRAAQSNPEQSLASIGGFTESVNRYLALKSLTSLLTGVAIWIWLLVLGVDFPLLWGLLAFFLNYVPSIGSIIAAIPAVILALVQLGVSSALITCAGYLAVNLTIGSFLEPRIMGRELGLSTLVVFLSLIFWGWVLGPIGMLLSVPLTMIVKLALESSEQTRWMGIILGSAPSDGAKSKAEPVRKNEIA